MNPANISEDVDFKQLILGFSSAALHYLGQSQLDTKVEKNLPLARHNIGIIELLRDKTKGNLTKEESTMIETVLKDLHIQYVDEVAKHSGA